MDRPRDRSLPHAAPGHRPPAGRLQLARLALLAAALAGCGGGSAVTVELVPVPTPDLSTAEEAVQEQIAAQRQALEQALADDDAEAAERAEAFGDLGLIYVVYDFLDAAEACFVNAERLASGDYRWHYLLGYIQLVQGRLAEAVPALERSLELEPTYLPSILRLGRARFELGDPQAARALFEQALALDPESAAAHEGLGRIADAGGDPQEAIASFERALALSESSNSLHYALGQAYRNLGDLERARFHLERSGDVPVRVPDPLLNPLANLGQSAQFYILQAAEAMDDAEYETAAAAYARALDQDPSSFVAHRGLAFALERLGDLDGAIVQLVEALDQVTEEDEAKLAEERAAILHSLGTLEAARGNDAAAAADLAMSLDLDPDQPAVLLKLGNALARQGRLEGAVAAYSRLLEAHPEIGPVALEKRATALVNLERGDEAIADFERALEIAPDDGRLRLRFSQALEFLGADRRADDERRRAESATAEPTGRAQLLADRARRALTEGRAAEAVELLTEALGLAPDEPSLLSQRAALLGRLGRFDEALTDYEKVLESAPQLASAHRGRVAVLLLQDRFGEARVALQQALRQLPRDAQLARTQVRLLATCPDPRVRDGDLALEIAQRLNEELFDPSTRESLALALAEVGRTDEAAEIQRRLLAEAEGNGNPDLVEAVRARLAAFEQGRAWSASSGAEILAGAG